MLYCVWIKQRTTFCFSSWKNRYVSKYQERDFKANREERRLMNAMWINSKNFRIIIMNIVNYWKGLRREPVNEGDEEIFIYYLHYPSRIIKDRILKLRRKFESRGRLRIPNKEGRRWRTTEGKQTKKNEEYNVNWYKGNWFFKILVLK